MTLITISLLLLYSLAAAAPIGHHDDALKRRQVATLCDQYGVWSGNGYEVHNNNWGKASATSGSQCTYVDSASSGGVSWHTTWTWDGNQDLVKSYAYSGRQFARGHIISSIKSMPTSVSWQYNTSNIGANVAYDIFTAENPDHATSSGDYELMIWCVFDLERGQVGTCSSSLDWLTVCLCRIGLLGDVVPHGSLKGSVSVGGRSWNFYVDTNGAMKVYKFVATSNIDSYNGDPKDFFNYLASNEGYPADTQNLIGMSTNCLAPLP